ncbi:MAG TPA: NifU N-terminal domain-containing protein, partial [Flavobacterium sp.]|uniref:NifU N-terminal domain-containing protein n=1 Tax=Flavobacterium sp. TaxID=239 RepID=UPI002B9D329F
MQKVTIRETQNPSILKFEFHDFITKNQNFEFKNIDETAPSPLAKQLFYLPFVKTVYISGNFIAIEKFSIVEWHEVKELVAEQIETFVDKGGKILNTEDSASKKIPVTVYSETTPNPSVMKFVASKMLTKI